MTMVPRLTILGDEDRWRRFLFLIFLAPWYATKVRRSTADMTAELSRVLVAA
jgi:hypothetical protein